MSDSLRSSAPRGAQPPWGLIHRNEVWPEKNWTPIPYGGWTIFVAGKQQSVKIWHDTCKNVQWWGPSFWCVGSGGEVCQKCEAVLPPEIEHYLLRAWELYVL